MSQFVLSCTTCATRAPGKDEISECLLHAPRAGYRAWGIAGPLLWTRGLVRWADADLLRRSAVEAGLQTCTEVYGPPFPTDSVAAARQAANDIALTFAFAAKVGSPLVVITGGRRQPGGLEATIAGIAELLPAIADRPVRLALEPHYRSQIQGPEDYDAILGAIASPQVGITIDTGHFHSASVDWKPFIRRYAGRIDNVHVKDHVGTQSVPLGRGEVDLHGYIQELHAIDYRGALAVELEVEDPQNLPRYCAEAYEYLSRLVQEVTGRPLPGDNETTERSTIDQGGRRK
jgi:sugar phosphate isomerase/epimerase